MKELPINRRLLAALSAVVVAALSWWLLTKVETGEPPTADAGGDVVDYYLKNFTLTAMDEDGVPAHALAADMLTHYAERDVAEISRPRMTVYRAGEAPWRVTADAGLLTMPDRLLLLQGDVRMARDAGPATAPLEVDTRDVLLRLNDDYAETAAPVTIRHPHGVTAAIGMTADLKEGRYELLQKVRGTYVVERN